MMSLYGTTGKTWSEMTSNEQKTFLIIIGIIVVGLIAYGIYYYFKNKKDKK